ncbi:hypothetical protein [Microvirga arabica]|uniref:hypothetical protein n=1 Tax=Microvirga arabica TaxID=1128671 RepID=UPI00193A6933|nr:hypothetical protein [Microvirga arabica]MBM1169625.1 hypothetical protein [Microvirga arabica]
MSEASSSNVIDARVRLEAAILPGLSVDLIWDAYARAPGNEIESGKFFSEESSSALVANAFGPFLDRPRDLPALPRTQHYSWPAISVRPEAIVRFPWSGGRHPCLDLLVETGNAVIGVESKRFEPYRSKSRATLSRVYWHRVWGDAMKGYESVRNGLDDDPLTFRRLDAAQLLKHAFGLRTAVHRNPAYAGKKPVLLYLFAEPEMWPDKRPLSHTDIATHRDEIRRFADLVAGDEVAFIWCTYSEVLDSWARTGDEWLVSHAAAVAKKFRL